MTTSLVRCLNMNERFSVKFWICGENFFIHEPTATSWFGNSKFKSFSSRIRNSLKLLGPGLIFTITIEKLHHWNVAQKWTEHISMEFVYLSRAQLQQNQQMYLLNIWFYIAASEDRLDNLSCALCGCRNK